MFEQAIRNKVRFSYKGQLSVEDLWDLSQTELNEIFLPLKVQLDQAEQGSLLGDKPKSLDTVKYKIDILKHIATTKKEEADKREKAIEKKKLRAQLLEILERNQNKKLESETPEQIMARLAVLDSEA